MGAQTLTGTQSVARVNLLPPEIAEKASVRRSQVLMGATVVTAVAAVLGGWMLQQSKISAAEGDLATARAQATQLEGDLAKLRNVSEIYARRQAAEAALTQAMSREVLWSNYMNNLGLTIPENVWLTELSIKQSLDTDPALAAAAASGGRAVFPSGIGAVTFKGRAFEYNDVAAWLESTARTKGYANVYATLVEEEALGERIIVTFDSSVNVTAAALSNRYNKTAGGVTR